MGIEEWRRGWMFFSSKSAALPEGGMTKLMSPYVKPELLYDHGPY
jgi:hypothetical protein